MTLDFLTPSGTGGGVAAASPLEPWLREAGASFETREGWLVATSFGSPDAELEALHTAAGIADRSAMGKLELQGTPDAVGSLLASVMLVPAHAQSNPPTAQRPAAAPTATNTAVQSHSDLWRASKLKGLNVYNDKNEKLGDINEILLDKSGKVAGVVIGVGGFLGMGEHDIMVEMSKLKFVNEPVRTSSTTTNTTTGAPANRPTTTATTTDHKWYPDHAVLSGATKESLKSMAQFKY